MQSQKRVEPIEIPEPTPEESEFLWKVRELNRMDPHEYLEFLLQFAPMHPPSRETSEGVEPFEL